MLRWCGPSGRPGHHDSGWFCHRMATACHMLLMHGVWLNTVGGSDCQSGLLPCCLRVGTFRAASLVCAHRLGWLVACCCRLCLLWRLSAVPPVCFRPLLASLVDWCRSRRLKVCNTSNGYWLRPLPAAAAAASFCSLLHLHPKLALSAAEQRLHILPGCYSSLSLVDPSILQPPGESRYQSPGICEKRSLAWSLA
jgi:hypothetical protein